jgi:hypothetical protein
VQAFLRIRTPTGLAGVGARLVSSLAAGRGAAGKTARDRLYQGQPRQSAGALGWGRAGGGVGAGRQVAGPHPAGFLSYAEGITS